MTIPRPPRLALLGLATALTLAMPLPARGQEPSAAVSVQRAIVAAPVARVWEVFTTAEGWKALGVALAEVDLKVGGTIRTRYSPNGTLGDDQTIVNTILALDPQRMLSIQATRAPKGFPFPPETLARMWSVIELEDLGDGRTRVSVRGHGFGADETSRRMREFFAQGNAWTLQRLAQHFGPAAEGPLDPLEVTADLPADCAEVFRRLTTPEGLKAHLGVEARVEVRVDGPYELEFGRNLPAGQRGSEGCRILSWLPGRMLSFTWNAPPSLPNARKERTLVVIELAADQPGRCRACLTHRGFAEAAERAPEHREEWVKTRAYFASAWPRFLEAIGAPAR